MLRISTYKNYCARLAVLCLMALLSFSLSANNGLFDKGLTREEAIADINFYFKVIDKQHGNPYLYISREDFKSLIAEKAASLPPSVTYHELSHILVELNQRIRCGHTKVSLNNNTFRAVTNEVQFFPYPVKIIGQEIYVDFEDGMLPHAARIKSINGHNTADILEALSALPVTDGFIETKVWRNIERKFGYYFFLSYGGHNAFRVSYEIQNGIEDEALVTADKGRKMLANNYFRPVYKKHDRYNRFTHLDAIDSLQTLVLTLNTFNAHPEWLYNRIMSNYDEQSKQFDFDNLVIDLRNNEGGDRRLLNILYQLVAGKALSDPSVNSTRTLQIDVDHLNAINGASGSEAVVRAEDYLHERFVRTTSGKFETEPLDWYAREFRLDLDLSSLRFSGQVYVLTSGNTYSAAADLARILGQLENVYLVGEETGGAHEARTANMLLSYQLPNTSLKVQVPVIYEQFVNAEEDNGRGRGTFPDFYVKQTYQNLKDKEDAVFEFTLDLIRQSQSMGSN